jgi:hypothetical protein
LRCGSNAPKPKLRIGGNGGVFVGGGGKVGGFISRGIVTCVNLGVMSGIVFGVVIDVVVGVVIGIVNELSFRRVMSVCLGPTLDKSKPLNPDLVPGI